MSSQLLLKWNNHQSVFDQLLHDDNFVDVTLAVEGQLLRAHKMILSACSPYFQIMFANHSDKHPIVILKDVLYSDMRSLLDFMYKGEVSVDQDHLTAFLRVAESLEIKGLPGVNKEKCETITSSPIPQQDNEINNPLSDLQRLPQKRFGNTLNNMLGDALEPKRKRGRPKKLSGSSNDLDDYVQPDAIIQSRPEMLKITDAIIQITMDMDGSTRNNSDSISVEPEERGENDENVKVILEPVSGTSEEHAFDNSTSKNNENDFKSSDS